MKKFLLSTSALLSLANILFSETDKFSPEFLSEYPETLTFSAIPDIKLNPPPLYSPRMRVWQGIPSIEVSDGGRLWATWYSGNLAEGAGGHFALLSTSGDDGKTWEEVAVFDPSTVLNGSSGDPNIWKDKNGKLHWILNYTLRHPDGAIRMVLYNEAIDAENPKTKWKKARIIGNGIELNKPMYLKSGKLLIPVDFMSKMNDRNRFYISDDDAKTSTYFSYWEEPRIVFTEHMIIERNDGTLLCMGRAKDAIVQAESKDGGKTWRSIEDFPIKCSINTRFHLRKLASGNILLIANDNPKSRSNMTAFLSDDEGRTWKYKLQLDEREYVSYPDATQTKDGFIYAIYDRGRYMKDMQEILFAKITEEDIKAGKIVNKDSKLRQLISTLAPYGGGVRSDWETGQMFKKYKAEEEARSAARKKASEK